MLGTGAGLIFKGAGFYITDSKKSSGAPAKDAPKDAPKEPEKKPAAKEKKKEEKT
jgi:predicted nucleic acid-binding Zn ribbon protein